MATAQYQGLPFYVTGVSGNGQVVVGYEDYEAVRWTASTGVVDLGPLDHPNQAFATNYDGSVAVGLSYFNYGGAINYSYESVRWVDGTMSYLGFLPGGYAREGQANAVSADGSVIVGWATATAGAPTPGDRYEAYRWTDGAMTELGFLPGDYRSIATGVSGDGSVVVGYSIGSGPLQAFTWTASTGMVGLGFLPGGTFSEATAISADGSVIVGWAFDASGQTEAFRCVDGTMSDLGPGIALATNGDGSVVVGTSDRPFLWDQVFGIQNLQDVLVSEYGLNIAGWGLENATGISTDGGTIVGNGYYVPAGHDEGFIASGLLVNRLVDGTYSVAAGHSDAIGMLGGSGIVQIGAGASLSVAGNNTSSDPVHYPNSVFSGSITGSGDLIKDGTGLWLFNGSFKSTGHLFVDAGTMEIGAAFGGNVILQTNSFDILKLDQPQSFTGTVSGLGPGDFIDLTNINFADHPNVKYFQKTDQLIVSDPHTKVSDSITLVGNYKPSDFILTDDGSGGVLITASSHGNAAATIAAPVNTLHETQILGSSVFDTQDGWLL